MGKAIAPLGTILGVWIGSRIQAKVMKKQNNREDEKRDKEKQEQDMFINQVVTNFLLTEIDWNYNILDISGTRCLPIEHKEHLRFNEFQEAKYLLLKNSNKLVREIIKLYSLFQDILAARPNRSDSGRLTILNQIIKQKGVIEDLTKKM